MGRKEEHKTERQNKNKDGKTPRTTERQEIKHRHNTQKRDIEKDRTNTQKKQRKTARQKGRKAEQKTKTT